MWRQERIRKDYDSFFLQRARGLIFVYLTLSAFFFFRASAAAQNQQVHLVHADSLLGYTNNGESFRELVGHVTMEHDSSVLKCDRAIQNLSEDIIKLYGNVRVYDDTLTLLTSRATYYGKTRTVFSNSGVYLNDRKRTLTADSGTYDSETKVAHFFSNVFVRDSLSRLNGDRLLFYRDDQKTISDGNVKIKSLQNNVTVYGSHFEDYGKKNYSIMTGKPLLVQIDTTTDGKIDTLYITSKLMRAFRDSSEQRFIAEDSVIILRDSLAARCGYSIYFAKDSMVVMQKSPVVWYGDNQLTGDSITVHIKDRNISQVDVVGASFAISRSDSLLSNRFNQMKGRRLTMFLSHRKVNRIIVENNATSLYYLYDKNKPNGVNKVSGDKVIMYFKDGKIDRIAVISGVEGDYYPEKLIADRTNDYNLAGFAYYSDRPEISDFPLRQDGVSK